MSLTNNERIALTKEFMERNIEPTPFPKANIQGALNAVDDWIESNIAGFNSAIPANIRSLLTMKQKLYILQLVLRRRFENG